VPHKKQRKQQLNKNEKQEEGSDGMESMEKEEKGKEGEDEVEEEEELNLWGEIHFFSSCRLTQFFFSFFSKNRTWTQCHSRTTKIRIKKVYKEEGVDFRPVLESWGEKLDGDVIYELRKQSERQLAHFYKMNEHDIQVMRSNLEQDRAKIKAQHLKKLTREKEGYIDDTRDKLWGTLYFFLFYLPPYLTIDFKDPEILPALNV